MQPRVGLRCRPADKSQGIELGLDGWLRRIGLKQYAQTFRENGIDLSILPDLTDQDLEKLGVLLGHRRKLLRAIADLEAIEKSAPAGAAATTGPAAPRPLDTAERRQLTIMFCDLCRACRSWRSSPSARNSYHPGSAAI
jgi:hypothetical protein